MNKNGGSVLQKIYVEKVDSKISFKTLPCTDRGKGWYVFRKFAFLCKSSFMATPNNSFVIII